MQASFNHFLEMMRSERNRMDDSSPLCYHIELVSVVLPNIPRSELSGDLVLIKSVSLDLVWRGI